ncbi:hypothetical protein VTO42DRAFT_5796 [Malbranchea cinnamomea]
MIRWFPFTKRQAETDDGEKQFPTRQLFVLGLCRICEPIAFMSIFPYVYFMVASFHVTDDDHQIALWAGAVTSSFTFAEFCAGVFWGRMSDRFGRKPVLMMGLAGTAISMIVFGFSSSLPMAMLARAVGGLLNGNIGVLQTTVAELVTNKKHQPRAYSIMPFVWCLGSILGPAMGGALAQPCDNYPSLFPRGTIFDRYPFLLPNIVCVVILLFGITIGILFLEETHADKKMHRDRGRELGRWLLAHVFFRTSSATKSNRKRLDHVGDTTPFLDEQDPPPGYESTQSSPVLKSVSAPMVPMRENLPKSQKAFSQIFTPNVIFIIVGYGILAYHSVSFDQLMPIFLSTPISDEKPSLPFKFVGGLGLPTKTIGLMMAVQGVYSMVAQLWLFPFVVRRFGTLRAYSFVLSVWPLLYLFVPFLILLPSVLQSAAVYASLICKITVHVIAFPASAMLLANAAPSTTVLGSINGVAASTASLSRAFGPTITGFLHSKGLEWGYSGLSWWACGIVCMIGAVESFWIEEEEREHGTNTEKGITNDLEADPECGIKPYFPRSASRDELTQLLLPPKRRLPLYRSTSMPGAISGRLQDIPGLELSPYDDLPRHPPRPVPH